MWTSTYSRLSIKAKTFVEKVVHLLRVYQTWHVILYCGDEREEAYYEEPGLVGVIKGVDYDIVYWVKDKEEEVET
jgi:hypothetical protein